MKPYTVKKSKSKKQIVLVLFIAFLMISSIVGYLWQGDDSEVTYRTTKVTRTSDGRWAMDVNGEPMIFTNHPAVVEAITLPKEAALLLSAQTVLITFNPEEYVTYEEVDYARFILSTFLQENQGKNIVNGVAIPSEMYPLPAITCQNATQNMPVVQFTHQNESGIEVDNNCIIIKSSYTGSTVQASERIMYALIGVIPDGN